MTDTTAIITPEAEAEKDIDNDPDDIQQPTSPSDEITPENGDTVSPHETPTNKKKTKPKQL